MAQDVGHCEVCHVKQLIDIKHKRDMDLMSLQVYSDCYMGNTLEEGKNGAWLVDYCNCPSKT